MKNKRLIILISIFAFLILIVILCSTLFTVQNVNTKWLTRLPEGHVLIDKDDEIINNVSKGGSIFLFNKKEATAELEQKYPYLKVVKIETKFPNKLVLHIADRQELFAVKLNDNCYVILDGDCKVLTTYNALQYGAISVPPITVEIKELSLTTDDFVVGQIAQVAKISNILNSINSALKTSGYDELGAKGFIKNIVIDFSYNASVEIKTSYANLSIKVSKIYENLSKKFVVGISAYNKAHDSGTTDSTIIVRELPDGIYEGEVVPN